MRKNIKKTEKLLKLYKELATIRDEMISYCEVIDDYFFNIRDKETELINQIKELENERG